MTVSATGPRVIPRTLGHSPGLTELQAVVVAASVTTAIASNLSMARIAK